ncbi:MAG: hypothetical protein WD355_11535 [Balneolaceae bacterium]
MKKFLITALVLAAAVAGCDLIDGTQVRNPDLLLSEAVNQPNSAQGLVNGLNRRVAYVYNDFLVTAELATDNYENKATFFNQNVDGGTYRFIDDDFDDAQRQIGRLREQAEFGLETVLEADPGAAGTALEAEMYFYKGWAHLLSGELFVALPAEAVETPQSPEFHFQAAIDAFTQANSISSDISYVMALARAHYNLGNRNEAVQFAQQVLSADSEFLRVAEYDGVNEPLNTMQDAVYDRQSFNDLQPLPRLDFLDPKYGDLPGTQESPVIMQSAEEAYLIIAEAQLSDGPAGLALAQQTLLDLLGLVDIREVRNFDETEEGRTGTAGTETRPNSSDYRVRADANSPYEDGLILDRTAVTPVATVSGTSVTSGDILGTTNANGDALELLYLMRQEIFFGEGRRMVDLGIKWPVSEIEYLNNENVTDAHIEAHIPSYIPSPYSTMDAFTVSGTDVTIAIDMNKVIAAQRGNKFN